MARVWNEADQVMVADQDNSWRNARPAVVVHHNVEARMVDVVHVDDPDAEVVQVHENDVEEA